MRELARTVLADRGYSVIEARNPEEAVRLADDHGSEIHLLLTDVVMPGMSGYDLAKRLKAQLSDLRVLYMSGDVMTDSQKKAPSRRTRLFCRSRSPRVC